MKTFIQDRFPKSERTLIKNKFHYDGLEFVNDIGSACKYHVIENGVERGLACYCGGRLLCFHGIDRQEGEAIKANEYTFTADGKRKLSDLLSDYSKVAHDIEEILP